MIKYTKLLFILLSTTMVGCLPSQKTTQCSSGENFNPATKRCVSNAPVIVGSIAISAASPATSYSVAQNAGPQNHSITVSDPNGYGYIAKWFLSRSTGLTTNVASNTLSYSLNPASLPIGIHTLEVILYDSTDTFQITTRQWIVNVSNDPTPELTNTTTPVSIAVAYDSTAAINLNATALNPDSSTDVKYEYSIDGISQGATALTATPSEVISLAVDPSTLTVGAHTVEVILYDDSVVPTVFYDYHAWTIVRQQPDLATVTAVAPDPSVTLEVIDQITLSSGGFDAGGVTDFCITFDDASGVDGVSGLTVRFYQGGALLGSVSSLATTTANVTCMNADGALDPSFTLVNPQIGETKSISARVFDVFSGLELTDPQLPLVWSLSVRPQNIRPNIYVDTTNADHDIVCTQTGSPFTTLTNCTVTQDTALDITVIVEDNDYPDYLGADIDHFRIDWFLNGVLEAGCSRAYVYALADKYICSLTVPSYDTNGPIDATTSSYTLTTQVTDQTLYPVAGSPGLQSNQVSWAITNVIAANTAPVLQAQTNDIVTNPNNTYVYEITTPAIELDNTSLTVAEYDTVTFDFSTTDAERDNYRIKLERCTDHALACLSTVVIGTIIVDRDDDSLFDRRTISYVLPDNTVEGTADGDEIAYFKATVTEYLEDGVTPSGLSDSEIISFNVQDTNYKQEFQNPATFFSPDPTVALYTMTGFPITLDPGTVTDDNVIEGATISYQWEISTDAGVSFNPIPGATEKDLIWTPDASYGYNLDGTLQSVQIRLCTGDDGFGNTIGTVGEVCTDSGDASVIATPTTWEVFIIPNTVMTAGYDAPNAVTKTGGEEVAIWHDPNSAIPVTYSAYATTDGYVVVEKIIHNNQLNDMVGSVFANTLTTNYVVDSVVFSTYFGDNTNNATNLSIVGETSDPTDASLYISYVAKDVGDGKNKLHVRRLDISEDKTGLTHPGTFGFVYEGLNSAISITSPGVDITKSVDANQQSVITFSGVTAADAITFTFGGTSSAFTLGTNFCTTTCSTTASAASSLAAAINTSTSLVTQGISATASGNDVTLSGVVGGSYDVLNTQVQDAGDIHIVDVGGSTFYWVVPYLDNEESGANQNTVYFYAGPVGLMDGPNNPAHQKVSALSDQSTEIETVSDGDRIMIMTKRTSGVVDIAEYTFSPYTATRVGTQTNIFNSMLVTDLRMAAGLDTTNLQLYMMAKSTITGELYLVTMTKTNATPGVYDFSFGASGISTPPLLIEDFNGDGTNDFNFEIDALASYDISAALADEEFYVSVATTSADATSPDRVFFLKGKKDSTNIYRLYCGPDQITCPSVHYEPSGFLVEADSRAKPLMMTVVEEDFTKGNAGATTNENIKNVVFLNYFIDSDGAGTARTQTTIINVEETDTPTTGLDLTSTSQPAYITPE
jgi:hypothetical protein